MFGMDFAKIGSEAALKIARLIVKLKSDRIFIILHLFLTEIPNMKLLRKLCTTFYIVNFRKFA